MGISSLSAASLPGCTHEQANCKCKAAAGTQSASAETCGMLESKPAYLLCNALAPPICSRCARCKIQAHAKALRAIPDCALDGNAARRLSFGQVGCNDGVTLTVAETVIARVQRARRKRRRLLHCPEYSDRKVAPKCMTGSLQQTLSTLMYSPESS